jgi:uncharacterized protein (TIGR02444 family)
LDWPANPFWDYALELYRRDGVERACLELQERHGVDVNILLFGCWLATRGIELERDWLTRAVAIVEGWQSDVVRPLRGVRRRLKAALVEPATGGIPVRWPKLAAELRQGVLSLEIEGERLEQLLLAELAADLAATAVPGAELAARNLRRYRRFTRHDRRALQTLLAAAFPNVAAADLAGHLAGLEP